jgi:glycosyltransferase involved in cell wall biosynthesis
MVSSTKIQERRREESQTISLVSAVRHPERWPRISLVTVAGNEAGKERAALESTMRSVIQQEYPNLEYSVVNADADLEIGNSEVYDGSLRVVRVTAPRESAVAALNAAFAQSSGEILGWLNAGELLHRGALFALGGIFSELPEVEWVTGIPTVFGANGEAIEVKHLERWSRSRFLAGGNKYIHRDTTFWRQSLWEKAGGAVTAEPAPEFELFLRFFRHARLYSASALFGGWRTHPGDFAGGRYREYNEACDEIADRELRTVSGFYAAKAFRSLTKFVNQIPIARRCWHKFVLRSLYRCPGPDWPPKIVNRDGRWQFQ